MVRQRMKNKVTPLVCARARAAPSITHRSTTGDDANNLSFFLRRSGDGFCGVRLEDRAGKQEHESLVSRFKER